MLDFGGRPLQGYQNSDLFVSLLDFSNNTILLAGSCYRITANVAPDDGRIDARTVQYFEATGTLVTARVTASTGFGSRQEPNECLGFALMGRSDTSAVWQSICRSLTEEKSEPQAAAEMAALQERFLGRFNHPLFATADDPFGIIGKTVVTKLDGFEEKHIVRSLLIGQPTPATGPGVVKLLVNGKIGQQSSRALVLEASADGSSRVQLEMQRDSSPFHGRSCPASTL